MGLHVFWPTQFLDPSPCFSYNLVNMAYTPRTRYTPLGADNPPPRVDTPRPGTPPGPGTPPRSRHPPNQVHPPDQVHPWRADTPQCRACWEIWSTHGRYASYWNPILFQCMDLRKLKWTWTRSEEKKLIITSKLSQSGILLIIKVNSILFNQNFKNN